MKAYYVELKIAAVVMAYSELDAMGIADIEAREIVLETDPEADCATEIKSIDHLQRLDALWDGMCIPYGGDGNTRLKDLLPESDPFVDTKTPDMFA